MKLICIRCPKSCEINIDGDNITGYDCPRGLNYAKEEISHPMRMVTTIIKTKNGVIPVKTSQNVPKEKIRSILHEIGKIKVDNAEIGDIIMEDCMGVDIIVTGNRVQ